jgi:hypothetical protein
MRILNVHQRELGAPPAEVGALLDSLASDDDALWPRGSWPRMQFDRPLAVGASGGHGPVAYAVDDYRPGRMIQFRFLGPRGFSGHHRFEVVSLGEGSTLLRHTIDARVTGPALLTWPVAIRPLHDALLEDALAQAQASLGLTPVITPWSPWVRLLRRLMFGGRAQPQRAPNPADNRTRAQSRADQSLKGRAGGGAE